jgi:hypothetical protein
MDYNRGIIEYTAVGALHFSYVMVYIYIIAGVFR